ncbi:MAG TPA: hypothetical protein VFZ26_14500 [Gemmatimonadales bacterium]
MADAIDARLRGVRAVIPRADLVVEYRAVATPDVHVAEPAPPGARSVYDSAAVATRYDDGCDTLYLACGAFARAICRPGEGRAVVSYLESEAAALGWLLSHALLTVSLMEMLKRRGAYALHAAALARRGTAVLFAGASGSGKTTLALALARAGFDFLGDDLAFLAPGEAGLKVLAFPDQIDVTAETAGLLPELAPFLGRKAIPGREKRGVFIEELYPVAVCAEAAPGLLVLPSVSPDGRTRVGPLAPADAFLELAPNVLLTDRDSSQAHLDALARLVDWSRCYRLETGRDLEAVAETLGALVPD